MLELPPDLIAARLLKTGQELHLRAASPLLIHVLNRMDMKEISKVSTDDDAMAACCHERFEIGYRLTVQVGNIKSQFH